MYRRVYVRSAAQRLVLHELSHGTPIYPHTDDVVLEVEKSPGVVCEPIVSPDDTYTNPRASSSNTSHRASSSSGTSYTSKSVDSSDTSSRVSSSGGKLQHPIPGDAISSTTRAPRYGRSVSQMLLNLERTMSTTRMGVGGPHKKTTTISRPEAVGSVFPPPMARSQSTKLTRNEMMPDVLRGTQLMRNATGLDLRIGGTKLARNETMPDVLRGTQLMRNATGLDLRIETKLTRNETMPDLLNRGTITRDSTRRPLTGSSVCYSDKTCPHPPFPQVSKSVGVGSNSYPNERKRFVDRRGELVYSNRKMHGGFSKPDVHKVLASRFKWRSWVVEARAETALTMDRFMYRTPHLKRSACTDIPLMYNESQEWL